MKQFLLFFFSFFLSVSIYASDGNYRFRSLSVDDGMPQNSPRCMVQDAYGYLWIGTESGLCRYNGYEFLVFKNEAENPQSLSNNYLNALAAFPNGDIIVGTDGSGLDWFNRESGTFTHFRKEVQCEADDRSNYIYSLLCAKNALYVGTANGIFVYDFFKQKLFHILQRETKEGEDFFHVIFELAIGKDGGVWVGSSTGLYRINPNDFSVIALPEEKSCFSNFLFYQNGAGMWVADREGGLYLHEDNDINEQQTRILQYFQGKSITSIQGDERYLWVSTNGDGLFKIDQVSGEISNIKASEEELRLKDNKLRSLLLDSNGVLFVGTHYSGLQILNTRSQPISSYRKDISGKHKFYPAGPICEGPDGKWYAGTNKGLYAINPEDLTCIHYEENVADPDALAMNMLTVLYVFGPDTLIVGTDGGLNMLNTRTGKMKRLRFQSKDGTELGYLSVWALQRSYDGSLWVGTWGEGLLNYNFRTDTWTQNSIGDDFPADNVLNIIEKPDHSLLLGTWGWGMLHFDPETKSCKSYGREEGLSDIIISMHLDPDGTIYAGSTDMGLFILNDDFAVKTHLSTKDGLTNNSILSMIADESGRLWLAGVNGLNAYEMETGIIHSYDFDDGLQSSEFSQWGTALCSDGSLLFSGVGGISHFHPDSLKETTFEPKVQFAGFSVFDRNISSENSRLIDKAIYENPQVNISYRERLIRFDVIAMNYANPGKTRYSYMLEGFDTTWTDLGHQRSIQFTSLPPGDYVLKVRASNDKGEWSTKISQLKIHVSPPFWKTWPFYIGVTVFLFIVVFTYIRMRERKLRKANRILEEKVQERTREVRQQKEIIEEKNKNILDSITYAKRIQEAILPAESMVHRLFPESFVFFRPKDIVSGDFYWFSESKDRKKVFFTAVDCTGHGVPGAFMTVFAYNLLSRAVNEKGMDSPAAILNFISSEIREMLWERYEGGNLRDGMDLALCMLDRENRTLKYSGAYNQLCLLTEGEMQEFKADKHPIGEPFEEGETYTEYSIQLEKGSRMYLFTDGLPDQFGGEKDKKFSSKRLKNLLLEISELPMQDQRKHVAETFEAWKGSREQIDDVLLMGVEW